MRFKIYDTAQEDPFDRFPRCLIAAVADDDGRYTLHIKLPNGQGLTSVDKFPLHEACLLAYDYADALGYSTRDVWIHLTERVLDEPAVLNRALKKRLQQKGLYQYAVKVLQPAKGG